MLTVFDVPNGHAMPVLQAKATLTLGAVYLVNLLIDTILELSHFYENALSCHLLLCGNIHPNSSPQAGKCLNLKNLSTPFLR